jgi:hypothetical protein
MDNTVEVLQSDSEAFIISLQTQSDYIVAISESPYLPGYGRRA